MSAMKNPWLKKNPLLSMWLSGANAAAGYTRGKVAAESKRQNAAMMNRGMKQVTDFWTGVLDVKPPRKRRKKRR
jgi:hypothetical protein